MRKVSKLSQQKQLNFFLALHSSFVLQNKAKYLFESFGTCIENFMHILLEIEMCYLVSVKPHLLLLLAQIKIFRGFFITYNTGYQHYCSSLFNKEEYIFSHLGSLEQLDLREEVIVYVSVLLLEKLCPNVYNCIF